MLLIKPRRFLFYFDNVCKSAENTNQGELMLIVNGSTRQWEPMTLSKHVCHQLNGAESESGANKKHQHK